MVELQRESSSGVDVKLRADYFFNVSTRAQAMVASAERFVYFAGIIAAAIVTLGVTQPKGYIIIAVAPYALCLIATYQLQLFTDVETLLLIKERVEREVNEALDEKLLVESDVMSQDYRQRWSVTLLTIAHLVLLGVAFALSYRATGDHVARWGFLNLHWLNFVGFFAIAVLPIRAFLELNAVPKTLPTDNEVETSPSHGRDDASGRSRVGA
jgi:hypothetical protein